MKFVRAEEKHLDWLAPLFDQYRQFYKFPSDLSSALSFLKERLQKKDSVVIIAIPENGKNEAAGFVQLYPSWSSLSLKPLWILNDIFVAESYRGNYVGKALMEKAHAYAKTTDAAGLQLQTAKDNHRAQNLYKSLGWKQDEDFLTFTKKI